MSRPDPIQYAESLYRAIRAANFSPMSFLAFGNAVKEGVAMRSMPRIAAEPFMRIVGEMLDLEEAADQDDIIDAAATEVSATTTSASDVSRHRPADIAHQESTPIEGASKPEVAEELVTPRPAAAQDKRRGTGKR